MRRPNAAPAAAAAALLLLASSLARVAAFEARTPVKVVRTTPSPPATPTPLPRPVPWRQPAPLPDGPLTLLPLAARCVEATFGRYTYEVCPFHNVSQRDSSYHYLLGLWEAPATPSPAPAGASSAAATTALLFTDGCSCGGKRRRATVALACGRAHAVLDVVEAPTCEYALTLAAPEACLREDGFKVV